jgi:hypothetical protein
LADNSLHNAFTEFHATGTEGIVDKCSSLGDVMNNLGIRLKDETLKQIDTIKDTSGNLRQSLKFNTKIFGESFATELYLADYYDFINKGVRGAESSERAPDSPYSYKDKQPPVSALKEWSHRKGLNEWAVSKSIFKKGIKKKGYFDKVVEDVKNGEIHSLLIQDLKSAGKLGILNEIKKIIK